MRSLSIKTTLIWIDSIFSGLRNCIGWCGVKTLTFGQLYGMQSCDTSILWIFFIKVYRQKYLISWTVASVFVLFYSIFVGLQNDLKILRRKRWPGPNVTERTFQCQILWHFSSLRAFSWLKVSALSCKTVIFRISSKNWVYLYDFCCFSSSFIFFERFACTPLKVGWENEFQRNHVFNVSSLL